VRPTRLELVTSGFHSLAAAQHSDNYNGWDLNLRDSAHFERGFSYHISEQLPMLSGASFLLMVLVCLNIASLLGQHAVRKKREAAIRAALGATPRHIPLQVLVEPAFLLELERCAIVDYTTFAQAESTFRATRSCSVANRLAAFLNWAVRAIIPTIFYDFHRFLTGSYCGI
jgi:hypothetical protein